MDIKAQIRGNDSQPRCLPYWATLTVEGSASNP